VESRLRAAALCSMSTMVSLAGAFVYQNASLQLAQAFGLTTTAGIVGALFGWCFVRGPSVGFWQTSSADDGAKAGTVRNRGAPGVKLRFPMRPDRLVAEKRSEA
jgi:hypothetical protein